MLSEDATWDGNAPAEISAIDRLRRVAGVQLPEEYLAFLAFSDGGEGPLAIDPGYIVIDCASTAASQKEEKTFEEFSQDFSCSAEMAEASCLLLTFEEPRRGRLL